VSEAETTQRRPLRLLAEDEEDLAVISAALQDALTTPGEMAYAAGARSLTLAVNRFCWECSGDEPIRIRAGLQFGGVLAVKSRGVDRGAKAAVVQILAVTFEPAAAPEDPGGAILIHLAGGGDVQVVVECVDVVLSDLSDPWPAKAAPTHDV
jgi:hypothetical protein